MPDEPAETKKPKTRKVKTAVEEPAIPQIPSENPISESFTSLINKISSLFQSFEKLQKEIEETKKSWAQEQKDHEVDMQRRNESYEYELQRQRKLDQDVFNDKKATWEKELQDQKDALVQDKKELEDLRKLVAGFEKEKQKAVEDTLAALRKELTDNYSIETKIANQQTHSEKEILALKITNLTQENSRLVSEISALKTALEEATRQVKDIAIKVIEGRSSPQQTQEVN